MKDTVFQSSAFGKRENVETTIDGRVMMDMLNVRGFPPNDRAVFMVALALLHSCLFVCADC